jgi:hypothetical protein
MEIVAPVLALSSYYYIVKMLQQMLTYTIIFREEFLKIDDERIRDELAILERQVSELGGLTAMGFFKVDRALLTNILGTTLTYLIILRDFRKS